MPPLLVPIGVVAPNGVGGNTGVCPSEAEADGVAAVARRIMRSLHDILLSRVEPGRVQSRICMQMVDEMARSTASAAAVAAAAVAEAAVPEGAVAEAAEVAAGTSA